MGSFGVIRKVGLWVVSLRLRLPVIHNSFFRSVGSLAQALTETDASSILRTPRLRLGSSAGIERRANSSPQNGALWFVEPATTRFTAQQ